MTTNDTPRAAEADPRGPILLRIARDALVRTFHPDLAPPAGGDVDPHPPWLSEPGATFVTLRLGGALRGCIGSLEADLPLIDDVRRNAVHAALRDPRFPPLRADELERITLEVSLLSPPEPFPVTSEADARARLRPMIDGVLLTYGDRRATFLPQVWESLPDPADFLAELKKKARLPPDFWHPAVELCRYTVSKWAEGE